MKKAKKLDPKKITPDMIMDIQVHDDECPFDTGAPCICTPTKTEMTVAQFAELCAKMPGKTLGEIVGHGKKRN